MKSTGKGKGYKKSDKKSFFDKKGSSSRAFKKATGFNSSTAKRTVLRKTPLRDLPKTSQRNTPKAERRTEQEHTNELYDVLVIGGGPAGMTAAARAAERGLKVLLVEKNDSLGKKLLITGGGRCNVTNAEFDNRKLLEKFKGAAKYLYSPFSKWDVQKTIQYFKERGLDTKIENEKRVFPVTDKAQSVWDILFRDLKKTGVTVRSRTEVTGFVLAKDAGADSNRPIVGVNTKEKGVIFAKSFILATGGKSHPETGSTGEGFEWLKTIGHTVIEPVASLVPIQIKSSDAYGEKNSWFKELQGVSLSDIRISVWQEGKREELKTGRVLFTHFGLTGPTILNMSKLVGELLGYGDVQIQLDLFPKLVHGDLDKKLLDIFAKENKKKVKNALSATATGGKEDGTVVGFSKSSLPAALHPILLTLAGISLDRECNSVTKEERSRLVHIMKALPLRVQALLGTSKAIVTSGGISLDEIDFKTMSSRKYKNLYLVGDVLDIDRPSGGYSLQLCWTTGFVAGDSILG